MAIPTDIPEWGNQLDPSDNDVFYADLRDPDLPLLEGEEEAQAFTVSLQLESQEAGLLIGTGAHAPALVDSGRKIRVYLSVDPTKRTNSVFDGDGIALPVTFTVEPDTNPTTSRQRSILVRVRQR